MQEQKLIKVEDFINEVIKYPRQSLKTIGKALDKTPTVDAVPVVHGHWTLGKCSKCNSHAPFWSMASTYYNSNYCPNCGAKMDKPVGNSDTLKDGEKK